MFAKGLTFLVLVFAVLCTLAKLWRCLACRRTKSTPFIYNASVVSLKLDDDKVLPTKSLETYCSHHQVLYPQTSLALSCFKNEQRGISIYLLISELFLGKRSRGFLTLRCKDVCRRDIKSLNISTYIWGLLANNNAK